MTQSICHSLNQSPFSSQCWEDCLNRVKDADCLILINDGVYGVLKEQPFTEKLAGKNCYAIKEDVLKRGLASVNINKEIELISYAQWVELTVKHPLNQSWF